MGTGPGNWTLLPAGPAGGGRWPAPWWLSPCSASGSSSPGRAGDPRPASSPARRPAPPFRWSRPAPAPPSSAPGAAPPPVSPAGEKLAYAAPAPPTVDGRPRCPNVVVVRDLRTGAERSWRYPDDDEHQSALYQESSITEMAWAPDSTRLAYTLAYEGDSVSILDTSRHKDLAETIELVVPGGGGDSRHPAWQASTGRL